MKRYYFIDDDLDDLEMVERELEARGVDTPQIHVLSQDDSGVQQHHLNEVHSLLRKDIIWSGEKGALIGVIVAALAILVAWLSGLPQTIGWTPFIFLSIILLGFFTWEGGLFGIQVPNSRFRRFENALKNGKHVFFVDVDPEQEPVLKQILAEHPRLRPAGTGSSSPRWVISWQRRWRDFIKASP